MPTLIFMELPDDGVVAPIVAEGKSLNECTHKLLSQLRDSDDNATGALFTAMGMLSEAASDDEWLEIATIDDKDMAGAGIHLEWIPTDS